MIFSAGEAKNDVGVYYHKRKVRKRMVSFYYISKDKNDMPVRPTEPKEWSTFFDENRIVRSTRKRAYEPSQQVAVPPDDGETFVTSPAELQDIAQQLSHSFWNEKKNKKLFNSSDVKTSLESWISQLKAAEFDAIELEKIVNKTESHPLEVHQAFSVQIKVMYLRRAYEFALHDMPGDCMSWHACCKQSIKVFENFGICKFQNYQTIQKWNVYF